MYIKKTVCDFSGTASSLIFIQCPKEQIEHFTGDQRTHSIDHHQLFAATVFPDGREINRNTLIALMGAIVARTAPGSTVVTDSVTSDQLTEFLEKRLGLKHHRFKRGYRNVINESIRLNQEGVESCLAIETSGHGALKEN